MIKTQLIFLCCSQWIGYNIFKGIYNVGPYFFTIRIYGRNLNAVTREKIGFPLGGPIHEVFVQKVCAACFAFMQKEKQNVQTYASSFSDLEILLFLIHSDRLSPRDRRVGIEGSMNEEVFIEPFNLHNLSMKPPLELKHSFDLSSKQNERLAPLFRRKSSPCTPSFVVVSFPRSLSRHPTAAILYTFNLTSG